MPRTIRTITNSPFFTINCSLLIPHSSLLIAPLSLAFSPFSCYIPYMTITQTVEIPASRRIFLELPLDLPVGRAKVTIMPEAARPAASIDEPSVNLRGLAKRMGSKLTVKDFLKMAKEDLDFEEERFQKFFPVKE